MWFYDIIFNNDQKITGLLVHLLCKYDYDERFLFSSLDDQYLKCYQKIRQG